MKLVKARFEDGKTVIPQTYFTPDKKWLIEKGRIGWNASQKDEKCTYDRYDYIFTCDTLREIKESLESM